MLIVLIVLIVELSKLIADHHVSCVSEHVPHARYTRWPWDGFLYQTTGCWLGNSSSE